MTGPGAGPAGRPATSVRPAGWQPPNLPSLLPGLGLTIGTAGCLLAATPLQRPRGGQSVLHLEPGPLQTPRFHRTPPWLSAAISGGWAGASGAGLLPGSAEAALMASPDDSTLLRRAAAGAAAMVRHRVGGAAWADPPAAAALARPGMGLLVVQCSGDAGRDRAMLLAVLARHDADRIVVAGALPPLAAKAATAGCRVLPPGAFDPWPLIELADEVHVADGGTLGLLALLAGRAVHAHAPAWFAGWGATEDGLDAPPRAATRSPVQIAAAGLLGGASYADPFTGQPTTFEAVLDIAVDWRRITDANRGIAGCVGMQFWKRQRIGAFLHDGARTPPHGAAALAAAQRTGGAIAAWASRMPAGLPARAPVLRVEDGFLRSVGLGSDFLPPCSIVLDGAGIYYDPSRPSDLEAILADAEFDSALLERSGRLIERLVRGAVTKYNVGAAPLPELPASARILLVPGQVADDLSVRLGGGAVQSNLALLQAVRAANPGAHILYKPHPDVDAGHRPGAMPDAQALEFADQIVRGVPMAPLIEAVHEVHTLTSLAGFEALLRRRTVTCWGQPFYAGWGLTRDMAPLPRRTRRLSLRELAAGVLLLYPRYLDPATGLPCPAEVLLDRLADPSLWRAGPLVRLRRMQGAAAGWVSGIAAWPARGRQAAGRNKA